MKAAPHTTGIYFCVLIALLGLVGCDTTPKASTPPDDLPALSFDRERIKRVAVVESSYFLKGQYVRFYHNKGEVGEEIVTGDNVGLAMAEALATALRQEGLQVDVLMLEDYDLSNMSNEELDQLLSYDVILHSFVKECTLDLTVEGKSQVVTSSMVTMLLVTFNNMTMPYDEVTSSATRSSREAASSTGYTVAINAMTQEYVRNVILQLNDSGLLK